MQYSISIYTKYAHLIITSTIHTVCIFTMLMVHACISKLVLCYELALLNHSTLVSLKYVKATHRDSTSALQHKTQGKRKADRWKIDCGRRRGEYKALLRCPSPKTLNYYWLLLYYFNNVHTYGPIRNKSLLVWHVHIIHLLVF